MKPKAVIGFAGMTHLGINHMAAAAAKGFAAIGFDADAALVAALARRELPVREPGLDELFASHAARLRFTSAAADLAACDIVYVAPDVPTDDRGESDLGPIHALVAAIRPALRHDALLVILSQVPPGFTRGLDWPAAQLFYQVETLIFGRAVERALQPERFILGVAQPREALPPAWEDFLRAFDCPLLPMRYESAELAKISINMCLVASVSTANTIADLCERIGADWREIAPALKLDRRIGAYAYLDAGLGISGGNLERDMATIVGLANAQGSDVDVVKAWQANSRYRKNWPLRVLHSTALRGGGDPVIGLLGLAYKQDTHSTKNSPALELLSALRPYAVRAFDPAVAARPAFHPRLTGCATALEVCEGADVLVIMTPWPEFRGLAPEEIRRHLRVPLVIDPYGVIEDAAAARAGLVHFRLGAGQS